MSVYCPVQLTNRIQGKSTQHSCMYKASGSTISDKALQLSYTLVVTMAHGFLFYRSCTPISGYKLLGDTFKKYNLIFIEF